METTNSILYKSGTKNTVPAFLFNSRGPTQESTLSGGHRYWSHRYCVYLTELKSAHSNTMTHKLFCRPITEEDVIPQLLIDCLRENIAVTYQIARHFAREWLHKEPKGTCVRATQWQTNTQEPEGNNCPTQLCGRKCFLHKGLRIGQNRLSERG